MEWVYDNFALLIAVTNVVFYYLFFKHVMDLKFVKKDVLGLFITAAVYTAFMYFVSFIFIPETVILEPFRSLAGVALTGICLAFFTKTKISHSLYLTLALTITMYSVFMLSCFFVGFITGFIFEEDIINYDLNTLIALILQIIFLTTIYIIRAKRKNNAAFIFDLAGKNKKPIVISSAIMLALYTVQRLQPIIMTVDGDDYIDVVINFLVMMILPFLLRRVYKVFKKL